MAFVLVGRCINTILESWCVSPAVALSFTGLRVGRVWDLQGSTGGHGGSEQPGPHGPANQRGLGLRQRATQEQEEVSVWPWVVLPLPKYLAEDQDNPHVFDLHILCVFATVYFTQ